MEDHHVVDYKGNYDFYLEEREKRKTSQDKISAPPLQKEKKPKQEKQAVKEKTSAREKQVPAKPAYSPEQAEKLLPEVELKIREYEALQKVLSEKIADPANQANLETSMSLAEEYAAQQKILDGLMEQWEQVMESLE